MNVTELKTQLEQALEGGLHPETEVVIAHDGWYFLVHPDVEHPLNSEYDMWFTLSFQQDGNQGDGIELSYVPADARFTPGHYPQPDAELYQMFLDDSGDPLLQTEDGNRILYDEWLQEQIDNYEQIWRESARDRDREGCEQLLIRLRPELRRMNGEPDA